MSREIDIKDHRECDYYVTLFIRIYRSFSVHPWNDYGEKNIGTQMRINLSSNDEQQLQISVDL